MKEIYKDDICIVSRSEVDPNRYYGNGKQTRLQFPMLKFQEGSPHISENGFSMEAVIAAMIDRLEQFNTGQFKCEHNDRALEHLREALGELENRVADRKAREVYDTNKG